MRFWELVRCAMAGMMRSRLRAALTVAGISIASGAMVSMLAFALGLQRQLETPFEAFGLLDNIEVTAKEGAGRDDSPLLDEAALARFEQLDGVDFAYPDFRLAEIRIRAGDRLASSYGVGLPREAALIGSVRSLLVAGEFFSLEQRPEAILGKELSAKLGFAAPGEAVGHEITIVAEGVARDDAGGFRLEREEFPVRVVGVFDPPSFASAFGAESVLLPVDLMGRMPGAMIESSLQALRAREGQVEVGYPQVIVRARKVQDVFRLEAMISQMGFNAHAVIGDLEDARRFFVFLDALLFAVGAVALIVAGLGILNTQLMTVLERYREIGVYKALGASDGDVRTLFLSEAATLGLLGGLGGLGLARVVSWLLQIGVDAYARSQKVFGKTVVFDFPIWLLAGGVGFAVVVSIVSGLYPASRAARIDPIRALRHE